jgi:hypothetical protein
MATLYVTEYASLNNDASAGGGVLLPKCPSLVDQAVTIPGASAPFSAGTRFIRVSTDSICSVKIGGTNPAATTAMARMAANGPPEFYAVNPGDKLAVVVNT